MELIMTAENENKAVPAETADCLSTGSPMQHFVGALYLLAFALGIALIFFGA